MVMDLSVYFPAFTQLGLMSGTGKFSCTFSLFIYLCSLPLKTLEGLSRLTSSNFVSSSSYFCIL